MIVPVLLGLGVAALVWSTRRKPLSELKEIHTYPVHPGDTVELNDNVIITNREFLNGLQNLLESPETIQEAEFKINAISKNYSLSGSLERYNTTKPTSRVVVREIPTRFVDKIIRGSEVYVL